MGHPEKATTMLTFSVTAWNVIRNKVCSEDTVWLLFRFAGDDNIMIRDSK